MRNFDEWDSYLDNDGNPLHGKIRFCRRATTDNIAITDADGVALPNPMPTDILGRTASQVFLGTRENVSAYFYKYVGSGEWDRWPPEDYDPERWSLQYEVSSVDPVDRLDLDVQGAPGVNTMDDLRSLDPATSPMVDGVKLTWLYGYYGAGDTSPVLYMWDSSCIEADDGGACIRANSVPGMGRWVLVSRELHFDVRHFGIFPTSDMYSTDTSYTSQIANCAPYLDRVGSDAWFPAIKSELSWYLFDGSNTFGIRGDIFISDSVRFHCKTGTTGTVITCHEVHKCTPGLFVSTVNTGTGTLRADWVNISWVGGNVTGDARVGWVIDSADYPRTIAGKEVKFITNGHSSLQLDNCRIISEKKITGPIAITNSILKTDFFADDYDWANLSSAGNRILLVNCKDADTYVVLKNKQNESDYGDLGEQALTGKTLLENAIVENAVFSGVTLQGSAEMHNISGTVVLQGSAPELNIVDCWLVVNGQSVALGSLQWRRGSVSAANRIQCLTSCKMWDVDVNAPLLTTGAEAVFERCRIGSAVTGQNISCTGCHIDAVVTTYDDTGTIGFMFDGCYFGADGRHAVAATTAGSQVVGTWVGNFAESVHPIQIDMTNILGSDAAHRYVYEDNHGKFLPRHPKKSLIELSVGWGYNQTPASQGSVSDPEIMFSLDSTGDIFGAIGDIRGILMRKLHIDIPFFAIGEALAVYSVRVAIKADCRYGGYTDPTTFAFDGDLEVTVADASAFNTGVFDGLLVGPPQPLPKNWVNNSDYPKRAYVTFERIV